ncbi:MAG: site-2 protease family protein [Planctomycetota bacterium]|nr:site-2 protease family protein [Planctomycetota bacterium]
MLGVGNETEFDLRFRLFNVPVRVHPFFWLSAAMVTWQGGHLPLTLIGIVCVFVSVLVHELGHALVARRYGFPSEITLVFLFGLASTTRMSPARNIKIGAAGPLAGLALAAIVYVLLLAASDDPVDFLRDYYAPNVFAVHMMLFFGIFGNVLNFLPCLPLDGGHITENLLQIYGPRRRNLREIVLQISIASSAIVALRGAWCLNSNAYVPMVPYWIFDWLPDPHMTIFSRLQPDPKGMMIFFGILCAFSINNLNKLKQWR